MLNFIFRMSILLILESNLKSIQLLVIHPSLPFPKSCLLWQRIPNYLFRYLMRLHRFHHLNSHSHSPSHSRSLSPSQTSNISLSFSVRRPSRRTYVIYLHGTLFSTGGSQIFKCIYCEFIYISVMCTLHASYIGPKAYKMTGGTIELARNLQNHHPRTLDDNLSRTMLPIVSGTQHTENIANLQHFNKEVSDDLLLHSSIHLDLPFRVIAN